MRNIHILGGGTFQHVRNHLSLATPAFGETARALSKLVVDYFETERPNDFGTNVYCHLTKMAAHDSNIITNDDVNDITSQIVRDPNTKIIFFNVAMCDFSGQIGHVESGKYAERLQTRMLAGATCAANMALTPTEKIIKKIRQVRKDIFLVAFKTTCDFSEQEQYIAGLNLVKENSCNLVLANDTVTRRNMIIVPEEAKYCVTTDREQVLRTLVDMTMKRSQNTFTRSKVLDGPSVPWNSPEVPDSLRAVVNYCIEQGAYKLFRGATAGHFAVKVDSETFLTSKRSTDFNQLATNGLVKVISSGPDSVIAYGAKPSVGGQSQRIIFREHEADNLDCIVHFHCPTWNTKDNMGLSVRSQYANECGSHECGQNTSSGLVEMWHGIWAVFLENHGPNIVFNRNIDPNYVIRFINHWFDLGSKTGGPVAI